MHDRYLVFSVSIHGCKWRISFIMYNGHFAAKIIACTTSNNFSTFRAGDPYKKYKAPICNGMLYGQYC